MKKVQINIYTSDLHKVASKAIEPYTRMVSNGSQWFEPKKMVFNGFQWFEPKMKWLPIDHLT